MSWSLLVQRCLRHSNINICIWNFLDLLCNSQYSEDFRSHWSNQWMAWTTLPSAGKCPHNWAWKRPTRSCSDSWKSSSAVKGRHRCIGPLNFSAHSWSRTSYSFYHQRLSILAQYGDLTSECETSLKFFLTYSNTLRSFELKVVVLTEQNCLKCVALLKYMQNWSINGDFILWLWCDDRWRYMIHLKKWGLIGLENSSIYFQS